MSTLLEGVDDRYLCGNPGNYCLKRLNLLRKIPYRYLSMLYVGQHLQCQLKVQTAPKIELREAHPGGYNPPIGTYRIVILLVLIGVAFHQQSNQ